jgi:hypothetical protein
MIARKHGTLVLMSTVVAALLVFVVVSNPVQAAPASPANTLGTWEYGAVKSVSVPAQRAADGWTYEGNATFGYTVSVWDNNTSASTFELTVLRTMGAAFSVRFCLSTCSNPSSWVSESYRAWESTDSFTNLTTLGSVTEGGASVPAVAVLNSTVFLRSNVTEQSNAYFPQLGQLGPHTHYLSASIAGDSSVVFAPALGLFPIDLSPGDSWNSTSQFTASGSADYSYYYSALAPARNTVIGPVSGSVALQRNGTVDLAGSYLAGSTFQFGGVSYPAIDLTIVGPFTVREGVVFVPAGADLFGSTSQPWDGNLNGSATAQMSKLDLKQLGNGRFGLVASSWTFASNSVNAADVVAATPTSDATPAATPVNPVSSTTVQGMPESGNQPYQVGQCLQTGSGCGSGSSGPSPRTLFGLIVIAGAVAAIGALLALAVVARRRKIPAPLYPNAVLYPPGATNPSSPAGAPSPPGGPTPAEDDPLDHLW